MIKRLVIHTPGQGLHEITDQIKALVQESAEVTGMCTIFIQHTSASLVIQENADPSAKHDLEVWFNRLAKEGDPAFTHNDEGPDDMPSHIKAALTATFLCIPIVDARLALGQWQGIYVWEHRRTAHERNLVVHIE